MLASCIQFEHLWLSYYMPYMVYVIYTGCMRIPSKGTVTISSMMYVASINALL